MVGRGRLVSFAIGAYPGEHVLENDVRWLGFVVAVFDNAEHVEFGFGAFDVNHVFERFG